MNKLGLDLIKKYEGFKDTAYLCPANVWTIGYGTTRYLNGKRVKEGDTITLEQAEIELIEKCKLIEKDIKRLLKDNIELNENQISALVSFVYNIGIGNFMNSTMLKLINQNKNKFEVSKEFNKWIKANGKPLTGLIRRRIEEMHLFEKLV